MGRGRHGLLLMLLSLVQYLVEHGTKQTISRDRFQTRPSLLAILYSLLNIYLGSFAKRALKMTLGSLLPMKLNRQLRGKTHKSYSTPGKQSY